MFQAIVKTLHYPKILILPSKKTFGKLWKEVKDKISQMVPGDHFTLRDLVDTPPANLGVKLYQNQKALGIQVLPKKDNLKTNIFKKL